MGQKIGNGAFGQVFEGTMKDPANLKKTIKVAIKIVSQSSFLNLNWKEIERKERSRNNLEAEYKILKHLQGEGKLLIRIITILEGIPVVYFFGKESNRYIMVMELLDKNLETVFSQESKQQNFSMMTIVLIVD